MLNTIADQIYLAIDQAELFENQKKATKREFILRKVIESARKSLNFEEVLMDICKEIADSFKIGRATIGKIPQDMISNAFVIIEHSASKDIKTSKDSTDFAPVPEYWKNYLLKGGETKSIANISKSNLPENVKKIYLELGVKSIISIPLGTGGFKWGGLFLSEYDTYKEWGQEDIDLLETIAAQIYVAIRQSELYEKEKQTAEREALLRQIVQTMLSSLDINLIKKTITEKVCKALNADSCWVINYDYIEDNFYADEFSEYISSPSEKSIIGHDGRNSDVKFFIDKYKQGQELIFNDVNEFIKENNLEGTPEANFLRTFDIKSSYNIPIAQGPKLFGILNLHYTKDYKTLDENDLDFLRSIANQAGIAFYQATLYKKTKMQAETESFNRKILEILRNVLDKETIKHLFVKNVGQYFHADRVFFADYDLKNNIYLPVDKQSEYLSSPKEKSFVGFDWSSAEASKYIQPLIDGRELKIYCWDNYIKENPSDKGFISRFVDVNVKSSYNLPVIYEGIIMGYFCIEFTQDDCTKLLDADIDRIRSMCTQAGIALYQAELFINAQESAKFKDKFVANIVSGAKEMLNNIIELSDEMSKTEIQCEKHIEHINHINAIVKDLLAFTGKIDDSGPENFPN